MVPQRRHHARTSNNFQLESGAWIPPEDTKQPNPFIHSFTYLLAKCQHSENNNTADNAKC